MRRSVHDLRKPAPVKCTECNSEELSHRKGYTVGFKPVSNYKVAICKKCNNRMVYDG